MESLLSIATRMLNAETLAISALFIVGVVATQAIPMGRKWKRTDAYMTLGLGILLLGSYVCIHTFEKNTAQEVSRLLLQNGPNYAVTFQRLGHSSLNKDSSPTDPLYLELIAYEKDWLRENPAISDIYTLKKDPDGKMQLIVDSETDYNRNGIYDSQREVRTPVGETYQSGLPELTGAFEGVSAFTMTPYTDKWGHWVSAFFPLKDRNGKIDGVLGVDFDAGVFTRHLALARRSALAWSSLMLLAVFAALKLSRRTHEQNLRLAEALNSAEQATQAKSQFLAKMSHEIRTPLSGMLGMTALLEEQKLSPEGARFLRIIKNSGETLLALINDILDFSKIESGHLQSETFPFDAHETVAEVIDLLSFQAGEKGVVLTCNIDASVPHSLLGEGNFFRQILMNLVSNAIKFTSKGSVSIEGTAERRHGKALQLRFSVRDTGIGISSRGKKMLFEAFHQVDSSSHKFVGGTGLGFSISKGLAEAVGGEIGVESELGKGSTFWFTFLVEQAQTTLAKESPSGTDPNEPFDGTHLRALVADDNSVNQLVATRFLQKLGFKDIDIAGNGAEALDLVALKRYDVILMDCQMPVMDGFEATQKICIRVSAEKKPKIIALTASATDDSRRLCLEAGMDGFLTKPLTLAQLSNVLHEHLSKKASVGAKAA